MNYETVPAETFGHGLKAILLNLLVRDVLAEVGFLTHVFAMQAHRVSRDFAIVLHAGQPFQLRPDVGERRRVWIETRQSEKANMLERLVSIDESEPLMRHWSEQPTLVRHWFKHNGDRSRPTS